MGEPRVILCQPIYGHVPPNAHLSQIELVLHAGTHGHLVGILTARDTYIDWGRNHIIAMAAEIEEVNEQFKGWTHLLWVDGDIIAPVDSLERLLVHAQDERLEDFGAVGGLYFKKGPPFEPVAYDFEPNDEGRMVGTYERTRKLDLTVDALHLVHGLGLGLTLMARPMIEAVSQHTNGQTFQTTLQFGEDVWFFHWASQLGFSVWLDTSVRCRHVGDFEYSLADWEAHRDEETSRG